MAHNQYCCSCKHSLIFFLLALFLQYLHTITSVESAAAGWQPMQCDAAVSMSLPSCNSFLYATSEGRSLSEIAAVFNANASTTLLRQIKRPSGVVDALVVVPCTCEVINATMSAALFHDTRYVVKTADTPGSVNNKIFSGLATVNFGDGLPLISGRTITVHLPCGCSSKGVVVSYAVQEGDTLHSIASLFRSTSQDILKLNPSLANPEFLKPGWILFVPIVGSS